MDAIDKPRKKSFITGLAFTRTVELYINDARDTALSTGYQFAITHWTITSVDTISYQAFMRRWNRFLVSVKRTFIGFSCIRVIEVHTGESVVKDVRCQNDVIYLSHGLHVHFICDRSYSLAIMRSLSRRAKLGSVKMSEWSSRSEDDVRISMEALSKYLKKDFGNNSPARKGSHRWAPVKCKNRVCVRDVVSISRWKVVYDRLNELQFFQEQHYDDKKRIINEAEIFSRLVFGSETNARKRIAELERDSCFDASICDAEFLFSILRPTYPNSPYFEDDIKGYAYMNIGNEGWPGVDLYLQWLQSAAGTQWALDRNQEKIERDRERQKQRQAKLANEKLRQEQIVAFLEIQCNTQKS